MFKKTLSLFVIVCFILTSIAPLPKAHADSILDLPAPGTMVSLSPEFNPSLLKGIKVHPDDPFRFDFILDKGDGQLSGDELKDESVDLTVSC